MLDLVNSKPNEAQIDNERATLLESILMYYFVWTRADKILLTPERLSLQSSLINF